METTGGFGLPDDWLEWKGTCHHKENLMKHAEAFIQNTKTKGLYLMYVWGHSYEFDNDNNWELIEQFSELIGGREDIWYATNIQIADYVKAYGQLKFSAACDFVYNPTAMSIWLSVDSITTEIPGGSTVCFV